MPPVWWWCGHGWGSPADGGGGVVVAGRGCRWRRMVGVVAVRMGGSSGGDRKEKVVCGGRW